MTSTTDTHWRRACAAADLGDEAALGVEIDGEPICVVRSGGRLYAVRDECSHADVQLSEGEVENGLIECWLHGSQFDLATGQPTSLPAIDPVPTYPVTIDGDDVLVDLHTNPKRG
ncbi:MULTISPECIES: non-heme iron oxygenase ferredoxin subunit [Parafrankia]|uniref:2Fe-2S ferredoxin n=1 Tax=Parafrankia soli TaxID=2599596 RepID=A0A1S1PRJ0_9ACTN|nr:MULTISPECIES: non-heme iron oxygenase ferredoxin subunit [Parafrankia]OHV24310.1 2Fe-2S ferredoxin [Parafrankia soli]TCJ37672.1 non-heme iron oxygenase ferredoxin subunit [Parafrankia sp. BMG5.11]CAI7979341.1 Biphenyl 2,3-dioxygenase, ferredoxin component [Frankia sp. Hr75.2]SQD97688.1 Fferredoxin containing (2Fe-2S) Rieske domain protein [Parafrankia sp. Ea1.12]